MPSRAELEALGTSQNGFSAAKCRKLAMMQGATLALMGVVEWRGTHTPITLLTNLPPCFIKAVLWEFYEIGW